MQGGWVCTNNSAENRFTRKPQIVDATELEQIEDPGASSLTLRGTLNYMKLKKPRCALLENVYSKQVVAAIIKAFHNEEELRVYEMVVFITQGSDWGFSSRTRIWAIAVVRWALRAPIATWRRDLIRCRNALAAQAEHVEDYYLAPSSPVVRQHVQALHTEKQISKQDSHWQPGHAMYEDHQIAREALKAKFGLVVPSGADLDPWMLGTSQLWTSARAREIVGITTYVAEKLAGLDLITSPPRAQCIWDVTGSIFRRRELRQRADGRPRIPCILRRHMYWDTKRQMEMLPVEQLMAMGFPRSVQLSGLKPIEVADLAGNTMQVQIVGACLGCMIKHVDFEVGPPANTVSEVSASPPPRAIDLRQRWPTRAPLPGSYMPGADCPERLARLDHSRATRDARA